MDLEAFILGAVAATIFWGLIAALHNSIRDSRGETGL